MPYKIGELARQAGCQVVTIRYYEKEGLLHEPERSGGNYRLYGEPELERLLFIRHCRKHGMQLSEIRELLAFRDNPSADCGWINSMMDDHIVNISQQIKSLKKLKSQLQQLQKKCSGNHHADCGILQSLNDIRHCPFCEDFRCQDESHADPVRQ